MNNAMYYYINVKNPRRPLIMTYFIAKIFALNIVKKNDFSTV